LENRPCNFNHRMNIKVIDVDLLSLASSVSTTDCELV
jgi:hypothetical protein